MVKRVEKALLSLLLAANELDVINQKDIYVSVVIAKFTSPFISDRTDEVIGELF